MQREGCDVSPRRTSVASLAGPREPCRVRADPRTAPVRRATSAHMRAGWQERRARAPHLIHCLGEGPAGACAKDVREHRCASPLRSLIRRHGRQRDLGADDGERWLVPAGRARLGERCYVAQIATRHVDAGHRCAAARVPGTMH
jgi:hypothetical protein